MGIVDIIIGVGLFILFLTTLLQSYNVRKANHRSWQLEDENEKLKHALVKAKGEAMIANHMKDKVYRAARNMVDAEKQHIEDQIYTIMLQRYGVENYVVVEYDGIQYVKWEENGRQRTMPLENITNY